MFRTTIRGYLQKADSSEREKDILANVDPVPPQTDAREGNRSRSLTKFAAYAWPGMITDSKHRERLLDLNHERGQLVSQCAQFTTNVIAGGKGRKPMTAGKDPDDLPEGISPAPAPKQTARERHYRENLSGTFVRTKGTRAAGIETLARRRLLPTEDGAIASRT